MSCCRKGIANCSVGSEFYFKLPDGKVLGSARNMVEFEALLWQVPLQSIIFHVKENHFAPWLEFMGEKELAGALAKVTPEDVSASDLPLLLSFAGRQYSCFGDCCCESKE